MRGLGSVVTARVDIALCSIDVLHLVAVVGGQ
jgi:hypothetical protein